jgi:hypothetical protein
VLAAALVTLLFAASSDRFHHWFILPVFVCGALAGVDAVDWFRGRVDVFDPAGLVGIFATFTLFGTPLLHVYWDVWMWEVAPPSDWRDWIGYMAAINVAAMLLYLGSRAFFSRRAKPSHAARIWQPDPQMFWVVGALLLCLTGVLQIWVFYQSGGVLGYMASLHSQDGRAFEGMGPLFMISESFPIVLAVMFIIYMTRQHKKQPWLLWTAFLLVFFILRLLCGGLRGSRLAVVASLFWMAGAIHYMVRPLPRRFVYGGAVCVLAFMYVFLTYKDGAPLEKIFDAEERARLHQIHQRSLEGVIVGDLGRTDVQAYVLYKLLSDPEQFTYARGDTYLYAASLLIPKTFLSDRPPDKTMYGADLIYGPGSYIPGVIWSSRIYGLAGELMLNFSPFAIPIGFIFLGFIVAQARYFIESLSPGDLRLFLAPLAGFMCIWIYLADSDNVVFQLVTNGTVPLLFIVAASRRVRLAPVPPLWSDEQFSSVRRIPQAG